MLSVRDYASIGKSYMHLSVEEFVNKEDHFVILRGLSISPVLYIAFFVFRQWDPELSPSGKKRVLDHKSIKIHL